MRLHDPDRPTIGHRLLYLNNYTVIQGLRILPLENGSFEISCFLPISNEDLNVSKRFETAVTDPETWLRHYADDPEWTVETLFENQSFRPNVRHRADSQSELLELNDLTLIESF